jgi:hypothetical protein
MDDVRALLIVTLLDIFSGLGLAIHLGGHFALLHRRQIRTDELMLGQRRRASVRKSSNIRAV